MNLTARRVAEAALFCIVLLALATGRAAHWIWTHRRQIADVTARAILGTFAAGQAAGRWCRAAHPHAVRAAATALRWGVAARQEFAWHCRVVEALVHAQPCAALAPITANLEAAWLALRYWVERLYYGTLRTVKPQH